MRVVVVLGTVLLLGPCRGWAAQKDTPPAYKDPSRPVAERVADLLGRMTLEEKVSQMTFKASAIERLDVPDGYWWNQCLSGVVSPHPTTQFPCCIGL